METKNKLRNKPKTQFRRPPETLKQAWLALAGLSAVFLFEMLDNSILNVALPTIGRELHASALSLGWATSSYSVVFGGLMLLFGALADKFGRRRMMLFGLTLLTIASVSTVFITNVEELIIVRSVMGLAAAMTTPLSMALAFRLFKEDSLRLRAMALISTVGLVGLAIGPTVGGLVLAIAPWQLLLILNAPVAILAFAGIRTGIDADASADLHPGPVDVVGAFLGTTAIVSALLTPTLFIDEGIKPWTPWGLTFVALASVLLFIVRERLTRHPLVDLNLIVVPLVSSGLLYKAATGLATAGLGYAVTLQFQLDYGWPPALAAIGLLPQVIVLLAAGPFIDRFVQKVGFHCAAWMSSASVVAGLTVYSLLNSFGYIWVALALVLVAAGIRVNGLVAGTNVFRGLPENRTSIGAALVDTSSEIATGIGIAVMSVLLATLFTGNFAGGNWNDSQTLQFHESTTVGSGILAVLAGALVVVGFIRSRKNSNPDNAS